MNIKELRQSRRLTIVLIFISVFFLIFNIWAAVSAAGGNPDQLIKIAISPLIGFAIGWLFIKAMYGLDRVIKIASWPKMSAWLKSRSSVAPVLGVIIGTILVTAFRRQDWYKNAFYNATSPIGAAGCMLAMLIVAYIRYGKLLRNAKK